MIDSQPCPECNGMYAYPLNALLICPECGHEWNPQEEPQGLVVRDVNGNRLQDGDSVTVIKSLPVKVLLNRSNREQKSAASNSWMATIISAVKSMALDR